MTFVVAGFALAGASGPPGGGGPPPDPRGETNNGLNYGASDANQILLWSASISGA